MVYFQKIYLINSCYRKNFLLLVFSVLFCVSFYGQNKKHVDSLENVFSKNQFTENDKLEILNDLAIHHFDTEKKIKYSTILIDASAKSNAVNFLFQGLLEKGNAYRLKSDLSEALKYYFKAAKVASDNSLQSRLTTINISIADVYSILGEKTTALGYYKKAIAVLRIEKDSLNLASALLNVGDLYINTGELQLALLHTLESEAIFKKLKSPTGLAYSLGNLGMIYAKLGFNNQAEININEAIAVLEKQKDYYPICIYLMFMTDIYSLKGDYVSSINYALKSLELAKKYKLKKEIAEADLKLSSLYENAKDFQKSIFYYKEFHLYNDSLKNLETVKKLAEVEMNYLISQKQNEVNVLNKDKKNHQAIAISSIISLTLVFFIALGLYRRNRFIQKTNIIIEAEKKRSDDLLLNILPEETAFELKHNGKVQAKRFESVTVLFTDFEGFTQYAEKLAPEKLVESIDYYFSKFDAIIEKYDLEKIKTSGDSYMCAGGLPFETNDHPLKMVLAAKEILEFVENSLNDNPLHQTRFKIRIGINTGPVVSGVVGTKKFAYDIWGDTVNIASRMETNSIPGRINVSENTYQCIKDSFDCEYRGEVEVKNRGILKMYFVNDFIG